MLEADFPDWKPGRGLPPFRPIGDAVRAALPALAPPARVTVAEAAERRNIESGGAWVEWSNDVAPYMVEPMEVVTSRRFNALIFAGPARCSKTEALILNPIAHAILASPRLVHVVHMTQQAAREFSIETLDKMLRHSPELRARLARGKGADNTFDKRFTGGMRLTVGWPVVHQLSARSIPLVLITDFDRMPPDIDGEGSAFALGRKRTEAHGTRGMTVCESSPGFPVLDETWSPASPHEAPPCGGVLGLYNGGTRARWYWRCEDCSGEFEPTFDRLKYPDEGTAAERGAAAFMACPHCGSVIPPSEKARRNRAGRWLHESGDGTPVPLGDTVRRTSIASYWLDGAAAAFAPWADIVARYLEAEAKFDRTGDEADLKTVVNVDLGRAYTPRSMSAAAGLSESRLRDGAADAEWRTAPRGTRFVTVAVDVQVGRFVVQAEAWGEGLERTLIDRFDIHSPPAGAPRSGDRRIDPARYLEDWSVLLPLADRAYPVATEGVALKPVAIVVDAGGEQGVTPNAFDFYRAARRTHPRRFRLVRGRGGDRVKRAEEATPETAHKGKRHVARDVRIIWAGTDRLKDEVAASLLREEEGARALHIPRGAPSEVFAEYAAERKGAKGWEKKPGVRRNEALDLSVYSLALAIVLGAEAVDWRAAPPWARPARENGFAVPLGGPEGEAEVPAAKPVARAVVKRARRRLDGW